MIFRRGTRVCTRGWRRALCATIAVIMSFSAHAAAIAQGDGADEEKAFNIPPSEMSEALQAYSEQADVEILYAEKDVAGKMSDGVSGARSREAALEEIIGDAGLTYEINEDGVVVIRTSFLDVREAVLPANNREMRVAQVTRDDETGPLRSDDEEEEKEPRDVIIVTGTNIRGIVPESSPTMTFTRDDIQISGAATAQDLMRTLPQNLDFSETAAAGFAGPSAGFNGGSAGVNIRGLGADSTLTLVNGRRFASGGGNGDFVDVSLIPLSAVERVEVLTDGASAIYGADAVAGVVNFILREDYDGAESQFRVGGVTEGSSQRYQVSQTVGKAWSGGNFLATYEYFQRNNLDANDRSFSKGAEDPTDLLPNQERHSAFVSGRQRFSERVEIFGTGHYSNNNTDINLTSPTSGFGRQISDIEQFGANLGFEVKVGGDWSVDTFGGFSRNSTDGTRLNEGTITSELTSQFDLWTVDIVSGGPLFSLPAGSARIAIGGQYRNENFGRTNMAPSSTDMLSLDRSVYALFGELFLPVVGNENRRPGVNSLGITVAGRFEDFSDFGSTSNPKVGIRYSPFDDLRFRGTYGTSFRAPGFFDLGRDGRFVPLPGFFFVPPPNPMGPIPNVLVLAGGNIDLGPETSRTWTAGFDYEPMLFSNLEFSLTYFDIDFENRIGTPGPSTSSALVSPEAFGESITFNPDQTVINELFNSPFLNNIFGIQPENIGVIVDTRLQNLASTNVRGIDADIHYSIETSIGNLKVDFNGSYLFDFVERTNPATEPFDSLNTVFNPIDWRFRTSAAWSRRGIDAVIFVNYVDDYESIRTGVETPVDSWTTVDLHLSYDTSYDFSNSFLEDTKISLNLQNLFNEDPPFVDLGFGLDVNFDGVNANALGRFISLNITKAW